LTLYEGMFLLDSADATHDWDGLRQHVTDMVTRCGGEILYTERWPERKLAYEIRGHRKGTYLLTYFRANGSAVAPIRRESGLSDRILRVLIVKNDGAVEEIERRKEAQQRGAILAPPVDLGTSVSAVGTFDADESQEEFGPDEAVPEGVDAPAVAAVGEETAEDEVEAAAGPEEEE
jgi:small subunit ribosomal protein S6